jgi:hypothetical protein
MSRLTDEQLAEIRERAEAATAGPWYCGTEYEQSKRGNYVASKATGGIVAAEQDGTDCELETHDAEFIAHAREDVPDLLAEIERLRDALEDIADTGESYHEHYCRDIAREALRNA